MSTVSKCYCQRLITRDLKGIQQTRIAQAAISDWLVRQTDAALRPANVSCTKEVTSSQTGISFQLFYGHRIWELVLLIDWLYTFKLMLLIDWLYTFKLVLLIDWLYSFKLVLLIAWLYTFKLVLLIDWLYTFKLVLLIDWLYTFKRLLTSYPCFLFPSSLSHFVTLQAWNCQPYPGTEMILFLLDIFRSQNSVHEFSNEVKKIKNKIHI